MLLFATQSFRLQATATNPKLKQATSALHQLKEDIDDRKAKLKSAYLFLDTKYSLYQQLLEMDKLAPSETLSRSLCQLQQAIQALENRIDKKQLSKKILDLEKKYNELTQNLTNYKAILYKI